jgi:RNA polymerase sigma-54 factor
MKQSLQLRLGQQLTMTPQLRQAIRLLQLSTLDLRTEVQEALESNPMLEADEGGEGEAGEAGTATPESSHSEPPDESPSQAQTDTAEAVPDASETTLGEAQADSGIPDDLPVDAAWDDIYDTGPVYSSASPTEDTREIYDTQAGSPGESLQDHLTWQLHLTPMSDRDLAIAEAIIDSVNEDGYLTSTVEELHQSLEGEYEIELDEVEAVLHRIQRFDPVGVAARSPEECLLIQLQELPADTPWRTEAMQVVDGHLNQLAARDFTQLKRRFKLSEEALDGLIALIRTLNPHPGSAISTTKAQYIVPDVFVRKHKGSWRVELNSEAAPRVRINASYASLVRRADNSADNTYLRNHLQEARWFIKSLQSRNETLLKVATCIVEHQRGFLEYGEEAMKPLVLRDVAEAVEMHESTISRVTTQKYMHTPRGIYEFKYFFSSHVSTAGGGECSSTAIRAMIKKLIAQEEAGKPLSDSKLATVLGEKGIKVARRTVAKYRESMGIPPSNERKRLA